MNAKNDLNIRPAIKIKRTRIYFSFILILSLVVILIMLQSPVRAATGDPINPVVSATNPLANAQQVDNRSSITVTFDSPMNTLTISKETFRVKDSKQNIINLLSLNYNDLTHTVSLLPATPLKLDSEYTVEVTTGVKNSNNIPLAANYTWSFKTAAFSPTPILSTSPSPGDLSVGLENHIVVKFNQVMKWDTINSTTFTLKEAAGSSIASNLTFVESDNLVELTPTSLKPNTSYRVTLTREVKDNTGKPLSEDYSWTFTTGTSLYFNPHGSFTAASSAACKSCHQTHTAVGTALLSNASQTQLCYTCHDGSGSSFNIKNQTDNAFTFHPIKDTGNTTIEASLKKYQCSECHDSHKLEKGNSTKLPGLDLCYKCHDKKFYGGTNLAEDTFQSTFSDTDNLQFNLHDLTKDGKAVHGVCSDCHVSAPHGSTRIGLLALIGDEYGKNSKLEADSKLATPGTWAVTSCNTVCHPAKTQPVTQTLQPLDPLLPGAETATPPTNSKPPASETVPTESAPNVTVPTETVPTDTSTGPPPTEITPTTSTSDPTPTPSQPEESISTELPSTTTTTSPSTSTSTEPSSTAPITPSASPSTLP